MDRWMARISKHTKVKGGLSVILEQWPEGKSVWDGFLHGFREAGGEIKTDTSNWYC